MALSITSVGHFFAAAVSDVQKAETFLDSKVKASVAFLNSSKAQDAEAKVEAVTSLLPGKVGTVGVNMERTLFAAAGPILALANEAVHATGDVASAAEAKLLDLTKDEQVVADLKQFILDTKDTALAIGYDFAQVAKTGIATTTATS